MKLIKQIFAYIFIVGLAVACVTDEDELYNLDYIQAPGKVTAVFDITQDNTGLVSIFPNAEGAQRYEIEFGDASDVTIEEINTGEVATHNYPEGVYTVGVTAIGITGLKTVYTQEITVSYKAPENLVVTLTKDAQNPKILTVKASADYATVFNVYFGDVDDEVPTSVLPDEELTHTYETAGDYVVRVVAKSGASTTTEYTETVNIPAASDPIVLPIDFESFTVAYGFVNFGNAVASVVDNPDANGLNTSAKVGQFVKTTGAETWAGTTLALKDPIDFSTYKNFKVKVWSPKAGATVKLKLENMDDGDIAIEIDASTTVANEWEELTFDFSAIDMSKDYQKVVLFFDFGNVGEDAVYYFDDVKQARASTIDTGIVGTWKVAAEAGSIGVGPNLGDVSWWAIDAAGVAERACFFDDMYVFGADGSFMNVLGSDTWVEEWQGGSNACGTPVAPHDGTVAATYTYDESAGTVTLNGKGAFLGIAKAFNNGELAAPADAPESITYTIALSEGSTVMIVDINVGSGWWRYKLVKEEAVANSPLDGEWVIAPEAGSIGVGPNFGDVSWWAIDAAGVTERACFYDDTYVFGADASFKNVLGSDTWVEEWQGGTNACGAPVAPHDGSVAATFTYDVDAGKVTLNGKGAYLGIPKAVNDAELSAPSEAPESVTYDIALSDNNTVMVLDINVGSGWWHYKLVKK